jgi:hypothetical protein
VASYHADAGHYAETDDGLQPFPAYASLSTVPPDPLLGSEGVYAYGPSGTFPDQTFRSDDYWVTPVFVPGLPPRLDADPSTSGQALSMTAAVGAGGPAPAGSVLFFAGQQEIGAVPLDGQAPGHAMLTGGLPAGTWSLVAVYPGPGVAVGGASQGVVQQVSGSKTATTTSVAVSPPSPAAAGQSITFTVIAAEREPLPARGRPKPLRIASSSGSACRTWPLRMSTSHSGSNFFQPPA